MTNGPTTWDQVNPTWDTALLSWLQILGFVRHRRRGRQRWLAAIVIAVAVIGLLPGLADAHDWQPAGDTTQLFVTPDGYNDDAPDGVVPAQLRIEGRGFKPLDAAQVFTCLAGETRPLHDECQVLSAAPVSPDGSFSASAVVGRPLFVNPRGEVISCNGDPAFGTKQCAVVAATFDPVSQQPTSRAEHYFCFGLGLGQKTNPHCNPNPAGGDPDATSTTTTMPPTTTTTRGPEWQPVQSMNVARQGLATAVGHDGRIYAFGGNDPDGDAIASAEVFDPCGAKTWSALPPMPVARTRFAATAGPDGRIYVIGGRENVFGTELSRVDAYDPSTKAWSQVASLALPRGNLAAVTAPDGRIYAIGGTVGGNGGSPEGTTVGAGVASAIVEVYDSVADSWAPAPPLIAARSDHGASVGPDGRIYVIGGLPFYGFTLGLYGPVPAVESYSAGPSGMPGVWTPSSASATSFPILPPEMAVTTGPDGLIYGTGGVIENGTVATRIWRTYETATKIWTESPEAMLSRRTTHAAATGRDGRIYAIGGAESPRNEDDPTTGPTPLASVEALQVGPNTCPRLTPPADFDGNGTSDVSVFRPSSGTWFIKDGTWANYGADGDISVPADYDGDQKVDVAIFRPATGLWAIHRSSDNTDTFVTYGISTDVPIPADYDGDHKADIAIFRPDYATWWIHRSSDNVDMPITFGIATDVPVPADYDGDGRADLAVFRDGTWFTLPTRGGSYIATAYGNPGDIPVPADYDADRTIDRAVFRPSDGTWSLHCSSDNTDESFAFGVGGDVPVPGDYNGDRIADPAVYRGGQWFIETGQTYSWGIGSDIPLPLPYAIRRGSIG